MSKQLFDLCFAAALSLVFCITTVDAQQPFVSEAPHYLAPNQPFAPNHTLPNQPHTPNQPIAPNQPFAPNQSGVPVQQFPTGQAPPNGSSYVARPPLAPPPAVVPPQAVFRPAPPAQHLPGAPQSGVVPLPANPVSLTQPHPLDGVDLDQLSDDELIELYIATSQTESRRRDVFDQSSLVVPDSLLVQIGYTYSYDVDEDDFRNDQHTYPELLLRYRLLPRLELRLAWAGVTNDKLTDQLSGLSDTDNRTADISIGGRLALWEQKGWVPRTSVTFASPFDLESDVNLFDRMDPLASVGYSWLVHDRWLFAGSSGAVWNREGSERYLDFQQSASVIYFLSEYSDVSLTWSGIFPEGSRIDGMAHSIGPGFSHSLTERLQIDVSTGFGIDDPSPDFLVQTFLTWRK